MYPDSKEQLGRYSITVSIANAKTLNILSSVLLHIHVIDEQPLVMETMRVVSFQQKQPPPRKQPEMPPLPRYEA